MVAEIINADNIFKNEHAAFGEASLDGIGSLGIGVE